MKTRNIYLIHFLISFLFFFMFSTSFAAEIISKLDLITIMEEIEESSIKRDIEGVMKHLSKDVVITIIVEMPTGNLTLSFNYKTYKKILVRTWNEVSNYSYKKSNQKFTIKNHGQRAVVATELAETFTVKGQIETTYSREIANFELINGRPMITKIMAKQTGQNVKYLSIGSDSQEGNWISKFRNLKTAGGKPPATPIKTLRHSSLPFRAGYSGMVFIKYNK